MTYLLLVPSQEAEEEKRFCLAGVWVYPNQFLLSSLKEAAKKLTLLISTMEDWYYAFVQVNEDAQHLPLSDVRYISILVDGAPSRSVCGHLSQLEVHQLLHLGGVVIYPGGLNGGLEPVWVTLPNLLLWKMGSTREDTQLQITLPRTTQGDSPQAVPLWSLTSVSSLHSITECPSEVVTGPSLTKEITDLLSNPLFKMSENSSAHNSPYSMAKKEGTPQSGKGTPGLPEATTSLSSWVFTGRYSLPRGSFLPIPLTQHSGEGHQPNSSHIIGQLHWPVRWMYCTFRRR